MTRIADLKARWMADPEFRAAYEEAEEEFAAVEAAARARLDGRAAPPPTVNDSQSAGR